MLKSKFSEHQIIAILKAVDARRTARDICRQISADLLFENRAQKDVIAKALKLAAKRGLVVILQTEHGLSERRACAAGSTTLSLSLRTATKCR
jgi:hypothetical protein